VGVKVGVANIFLVQSVGIDENNRIRIRIRIYLSSIKTVGVTVLGGLWALEWAWQSTETNLRCVRISGICTPNLNSLALIVSEISSIPFYSTSNGYNYSLIITHRLFLISH